MRQHHATVRRLLVGIAAMVAVLAPAGPCDAATVTVEASDMGWYSASAGGHGPTSTNYAAGEGFLAVQLRNFFVFDLAGIGGTVVAATLRVYNPADGCATPNAWETYRAWDVSTPIATLVAGGSGLTDVYDDLGGGSTYGSVNISPSENDSLIALTLNATALADLTAALGGQFAIGGAVTTLGSSGNEYVFAFSDETSTQQLELVTTCGDGDVDAGEECDDGNAVNGDCCSTSCRAETGDPCADDGQPCSDDVCDAAGTCTHAVTSAGTECRASAGICDASESCDGTSTACPADAKSTVVCRSSAGACDVAEACDGLGAHCPPDALAADGSTCDDGDACTQSDACGAGVCSGGDPLDCDDGNGCTQDTCTPEVGCVNDSTVRAGCLIAAKSVLMLKQNGGVKDQLLWKWDRGQAMSYLDLDDPTTTTDYALCIHSGPDDALIADTALDGGGGWKARGSQSYAYHDPIGVPDGIRKALIKSGVVARTKAEVKGRGSNLPDPVLGSVVPPVTVQLVNLESGFCLESVYEEGDVSEISDTRLKAKRQ